VKNDGKVGFVVMVGTKGKRESYQDLKDFREDCNMSSKLQI
jgi:hypothetical protein